MSLLDAKCPNCGQILKVDDAKEAAICEFCGSAFIVEKAINNYNITGSVTIGEGAVIYNSDSVDKLLANGETALRIKNYDLALETYSKCTKSYPEDYKGWWGYIRAYTKDFTAVDKEMNTHAIHQCYTYILSLCTDSAEIAKMEDTYKGYLYRMAQMDVSDVKETARKKADEYNEAITSGSLVRVLKNAQRKLKGAESDKNHKTVDSTVAAVCACLSVVALMVGAAFGNGGAIALSILVAAVLIFVAYHFMVLAKDYESLETLNNSITSTTNEVASLSERVATTRAKAQKLAQLQQISGDIFSRFLYIEYCNKYQLNPGGMVREYNMMKQILTTNEIKYILR